MEGEGFRRARLCRLCEGPIVNGGVRLQKQGMEKLSKWWKSHLNISFEETNCMVCHFCIWDMRFADQHSEEKETRDQTWWTKEDMKNGYQNYYKYYTDEWMKPCSVNIALLPKVYRQEKTRHCLYCPQSFANHQSLFDHAKIVHADELIYCNKGRCGMLFHTEGEKEEHFNTVHQTKDSLKCFYCGKVSTNYIRSYNHLQKHHKHQIIRCKHKACSQMFKTKEERDKHFADLHNFGEHFCRFCDRYFEHQKSYASHMRYYHKEALKCQVVKGCSNYFKTEKERQKHVQKMHSEVSQCFYCKANFRSASTLHIHIDRFHKDVALRCEHSFRCSTWFQTEEERQKHYEENHENGANCVLCPFCLKKYPKPLGIQRHFKIHHPEEKVLKCNYNLFCANYFKNEEDRLKHVKEFHNSKIRCLHCDKIFSKCQYMFNHVRKDHKDVAIRCNFNVKCGTYFKTLENREKHVREVHQAEKIREPLPCLYCDQILSGRDTLGSHVRLKHAETAIRCHFRRCATYFKSQDELQVHFSLYPKHQQNKVLPTKFQCALCIKSYMSKSAMGQHMNFAHINSLVTGALCPHCSKPTSSKTNHIMSDFCKVCNQKFLCLGLFKSHTLKCRRAIQCPVCAKSFKKQCFLNYHCKRNHTVPILKWTGLEFKSRGFKCDECLMYFSSKCSLKMHRLCSKVTCDMCKLKFVKKTSLESHITRYHLSQEKLRSVKKPRKNVQNDDNIKLFECKLCVKKVKKYKPRALKSHIQRMH